MDLAPAPCPVVSVAPQASAHLLAALREAVEEEPCGYLLGLRAQGGALEILEAVGGTNRHPSPMAGFLLAPEEQLEVRRAARGRGVRVIGTWHGHLCGPGRPSEADIRGHVAGGLACMLIVARDDDGTPHVRAHVTGDGGVREVAAR